jgi:site-specific recombinase XerD
MKYRSNIPLNEISQMNVEEFIRIRCQNVKPTTVNIELRVLKSMFNTAVEWNLIDRNPLRGVQMMRVQKTYPKFLTNEEVNLLCNTTNFEWLKNIIIFAFNTGMRRNEIINLKWEDINLKEKYLIVRNNDTFSTKSKKDRIIPLSKSVICLLSTISKVTEYLFVNRMKLRLYPNYVTQCFRDLVKECGLRKGISFHSLRHSFASMLVSKGVSLYVVKELLGHSDFATTQIYAHLESKSLKDAIEKLNN